MHRKWELVAIAFMLAAQSSGASAAARHKPVKLKPGPAAGVHQAKSSVMNGPAILLVGAGVVIGGVALVVSGGGHKAPTSTSASPNNTSSTTSTSGT